LSNGYSGLERIAVNSDLQTSRKSPLKNPILYSSILLLAAAMYAGFVAIGRYQSKRDFEQRTAAEQAEKRLAGDRLAIEQLGGSELTIRTFYVSPSEIRPGESAQLCYDVANAKTVTLEPPVAEVWPSHSRCIEVKVKKSTTYTLTIADPSGQRASQSVELKVR
jgi:hypothetical protein